MNDLAHGNKRYDASRKSANAPRTTSRKNSARELTQRSQHLIFDPKKTPNAPIPEGVPQRRLFNEVTTSVRRVDTHGKVNASKKKFDFFLDKRQNTGKFLFHKQT